jgi:hypothetical protein
MPKKDRLAGFVFIVLMGSLVGFSFYSTANAEQSKRKDKAKQSSIRKSKVALLNSLGSYPGTTLIREYALKNVVGREYATELSLDEAPTAVTMFYERKLTAQGWKVLERHAAVSGYVKRNQAVCILRYGPDDPGLPPGARLRKEAPPPANTRFFFAIEIGPRPRD